MKACEALIAWTPNFPHNAADPTCGQVKVGPLLSKGSSDWTAPYSMTTGAAFMAVRKMTGWQAIAMVFIEFNTMVAGYNIDPKTAHQAFLAIDEYRQRITRDLPGAEDIPESEEDPDEA